MRFPALGLAATSLAAAAALISASGAEAAQQFVISPAFQPLSLEAGQPGAGYTLEMANQTDNGQNFHLSLLDFGALDEQGGVAFLGRPATELEHRYGLVSWIKLEKDTLFIGARQTADVKVTIENRPTLAPGGHYGAVLATAVSEAGQSAPDPRVGIKQVLSSLILVTKEGGAERRLDLVSQAPNRAGLGMPSWIDQRYQNTGNVHLVPRGIVEVKDSAGRLVQRGAINEDSGVILPESFRHYKAALIRQGRAWMPGRYAIVTHYRYDGTEDTKVMESHFWYAGEIVLWLTGVSALLAAAALAWWSRRRWLKLKRR